MAQKHQVNGEPINLKPEFPYTFTELPINWEDAIQTHIQPELEDGMDEMSQTQKGVLIHESIEEFFGDIDWLQFEEEVEYMDGRDAWGKGTYDAFDGAFVYEFKTKHPHVFEKQEKYDDVLPREDDMAQLNKYLAGTGSDWGILVYINRDNFEVQEYLIEREYVGFYESDA